MQVHKNSVLILLGLSIMSSSSILRLGWGLLAAYVELERFIHQDTSHNGCYSRKAGNYRYLSGTVNINLSIYQVRGIKIKRSSIAFRHISRIEYT